MTSHKLPREVVETRQAALEVLLNNRKGPFQGLPRTAARGYPEPYTRDLMIASLGYAASGEQKLLEALEATLAALARNQTRLGHIPSLAHDPDDRGASDSTPLFLFALAVYRETARRPDFLQSAAETSLRWMEYQSPDDLVMVAQQPTTDWRDEHWVLGYGLYVNSIVYAYLRLFGLDQQADHLRKLMNRLDVRGNKPQRHVHEGLVVKTKPYFALWSFKMENNERFDLLGNAWAILTGIASPTRSKDMVAWIEAECGALKEKGELALDLPPCLIPYIQPSAPDWRRRYDQFNQPGEYHNGGIWPFICGFYVAALIAAGRPRLAEQSLLALTRLVRQKKTAPTEYGFNEWFKAQDGTARGQDGQTWSAAMYLYAVRCVETNCTPFFDNMRQKHPSKASAPIAPGPSPE